MARLVLAPNLQISAAEAIGPLPLVGEGRPPPAEWRPPPLSLQAPPGSSRDPATSLPDPFYRREATALALRGAGGEALAAWGVAVRALAAGLLRVEPLDLAEGQGAFGRALARMHPSRRRLCALHARLPGGERIVAISDEELLLWPAARLGPGDWAALNRELGALPPGRDPLALLADLRACLVAAHLFGPERPLWMSGLDAILGDRLASEGLVHLRQHSLAVGPIPLRLGKEAAAVYFPTASPGAGALLRRLAMARFGRDRQGDLLARDRAGQAQLRLRLPGGLDDEDRKRWGLGVVERLDSAPPDWSESVTLHAADGLFASAGPALYPPQGLDVAELWRLPFCFPDPLRVLVDALGEAGLPAAAARGASAVGYSPEALQQSLLRGWRLPQARELRASPGLGFVFGRAPQVQAYVEQPGAVMDLAPIGAALFAAFGGGLSARPDGLFRGSERLLFVENLRLRAEIEAMDPLDEATRSGLRSRQRAQVQRFCRAWSLHEAPAAAGEALVDLLRAAAWAFAAWVEPPFPNGPRAHRSLRWALGDPFGAIELPVDPSLEPRS